MRTIGQRPAGVPGLWPRTVRAVRTIAGRAPPGSAVLGYLVGPTLAFALAACGDGGDAATKSPGGDSGAPAAVADAAGDALLSSAHNDNPDGVPYPAPAGGYGDSARKGKTPGSIIANFKFFGYPDADESKGLQTIALADYYDPCNKRYKLLHLSVAAVWCEPCNEETVALVAAKAQLATEKVVLVQALSDGPTKNVPATTADLQYWIQENKSNFTEMLDPNLANLGTFFNAAAVPWNADIDPRTMEILDDGTGYAGSAALELQPGIAAAAEPPDYPIAIQCN
jgi:hypothetical protein